MISTPIRKVLEAFPPERPLLLLGDNLREAEESIEWLRERAGRAGIESQQAFNGSELGWASLLAEVATGDLFGDRLIVVRHAEELREDTPGPAEKLLRNLPAGVVLVLQAEKLDGRKKITKTLQDRCAVLKCALPDPRHLPEWISDYVRSQGYVIDRGAAALAAELMDNDSLLIASELDKVILYTNDRKRITEEDIGACLAFSREEKPWNMADDLIGGDPGAALVSARRLREIGAEPTQTLAMLSRKLRMLHELSCLSGRRLSNPEIAKRLGLSGGQSYYIGRDMETARRLTRQRLGMALAELVRVESLLKSAAGVDRDMLLDVLIHSVHRRLTGPVPTGRG